MEWLGILGIILIVLGFVFVGIEMMIPGFGAPGITGICCLIAGIFLSADTIGEAIVIIAIILILLAIMFVIILCLLSKGKLKTPIVLEEHQEREDGYISSKDLNYLIGKRGMASTDLRPAGRAVFDDIEFDVMSDGRFILKGAKVEIYKISNSTLVVK